MLREQLPPGPHQQRGTPPGPKPCLSITSPTPPTSSKAPTETLLPNKPCFPVCPVTTFTHRPRQSNWSPHPILRPTGPGSNSYSFLLWQLGPLILGPPLFELKAGI